MITTDDLVNREVHHCISFLMSTLAQGCGAIQNTGPHAHPAHRSAGPDNLAALCEAAFELSTPILDYEEAAIQAGWTYEPRVWTRPKTDDDPNPNDGNVMATATAIHACRCDDLEPIDREVFEHWIVSDWLARKLEAKGEKVDFDFAGLTVWVRTTTGQAITQDAVIQEIHAEMQQQ